MKIESTQFTEADINSFITDYFEHERKQLITRLRKIIEDTETLIPSIQDRSEPAEESWSAGETLAHMVISAQFFGWLIHEIVAKNPAVADQIFEMLKMRDVAGNDAARLPADTLAKQLRETIENTIEFISNVTVDDLRTSIKYISRELTAEDVVRIPLCGHLEEHIDQIREATGAR